MDDRLNYKLAQGLKIGASLVYDRVLMLLSNQLDILVNEKFDDYSKNKLKHIISKELEQL